VTQKQRQSQRKVAEDLFSKLIKARDQWCQRCGTPEWPQAAHVISRSYRAVAFEPNNAMQLCRSCHKWQTEHPLEGVDFFREQLGSAFYDELEYRAKRGAAVGFRVDYKTLIPDLRRRLEATAA